MIQIFSPYGWALNWQLLDNWDSWTFSHPFSQIHSCFNAPWGSSFMNPGPCSTTNSVQHNTFIRCLPVVREFGVWCTWQGWRNITRRSPVPHPCTYLPVPPRVLLNNKLEGTLSTRRANKHVGPAQTEALLSLSESAFFDHHGYQLPSDIVGCAGWAWTLAGWRKTPRQGRKEWFSCSSLWVNIYPAALGLGEGWSLSGVTFPPSWAK